MNYVMSDVAHLMSSSERRRKKVWSDVGSWQPEAELSAGKIRNTADRTQKRRCRWKGNKEELSCRVTATCKSLCLLVSVCLSVSFPDVHSQSLPHVTVFLVSYFLPHIFALSPPPTSLSGSCAGDGCVPMVQAGCGVPGGPHDSYWCSGVQLLAHRDPRAAHTNTDVHTGMRWNVVHIHASRHVIAQLHINCVFLCCRRGSVNSTKDLFL